MTKQFLKKISNDILRNYYFSFSFTEEIKIRSQKHVVQLLRVSTSEKKKKAKLTCKEVSSGCSSASCLTRSSSRFTRVVYLRFRVSRSRTTLSTVITESLRGLFTDASNDGQISSNCSLNARSLCP